MDKNLRAHGLIQAYSRTNRILNSVKTYGNIVAFRDLENETNAALELFGNKDARGIVLLKPYTEYYNQYAAKVRQLLTEFPPGDVTVGEGAQKAFIALFGQILRLENILTAFDDFAGHERLTPRQHQDYQSAYLELHAEFKKLRESDKDHITEDVVFEIELVKQVEINVDYILMRVDKYRTGFGVGDDKEIRAEITRAVNASPTLRNKRDLVEAFVDSVSPSGRVDDAWQAFIIAKREAELQAIIDDESLKPDETRAFIEAAFRDGAIQSTGTAITRVLPPTRRFGTIGGDGHGEKKARVLKRLQTFFERFSGLG